MGQLFLIGSVSALIGIGTLAACEGGRDRPVGEGAHPQGWGLEESPAFHGAALRAQGYPLDECRSCHGGDFAGGDVGISCSDNGGCHQNGVEDCAGTCHGDDMGPLPASGRHARHIAFIECADCHPVPDGLEDGTHINRTLEVSLGGQAALDGRLPTWDAEARGCSDVYCHDGDSPSWDDDTPLGCDGCHQQSPTHDRFERVVSEDRCGECHQGSPDVGHIDGALVIGEPACNACHGTGVDGAPPVALDGSSDPTIPAVGAHRRHLDPLLPGRIGKVAPCSRCHAVPDQLFAAGHLDADAPADVDVILGDYDPVSSSCVVSCHFDRDPGPVWTDTSGAELACDACHGFPPVTTRIGTRHPPTSPQLSVCLGCHTFDVQTHVNGEVNFQ